MILQVDYIYPTHERRQRSKAEKNRKGYEEGNELTDLRLTDHLADYG